MNNIDFNNETIVLIVSDVHLGASGVKHNDFIDFLSIVYSKKDQGELELLKTLIITGDFFDLCMDSYRDLSKENLDIYDNLIKLQDKGIEIIITLGNHEIPTTWCHDRCFKSRKNEFINDFEEQFEKNNGYLEFFKKIKFCQYCFLQKNRNNKWEINLYDKKKQLAKNEISIDIDAKPKFLFAHGYQFEPWYRLFIASFVWAYSIKNTDIHKEINNILYNEIYKNLEIQLNEESIKTELQKPSIIEFLDTRQAKPEEIDIKKLKKLIKRNRKSNSRQEKNKEKNERYFKKAFKFLKNKKYSHISHVIFGHTHAQGYKKDKNNKYIRNAGAWQNVTKAHYIEILVDGKVIYNDYP
jgi:UDP-2,3-diacylglucosamine pyrophosphatase LpxH